MLHWIPENAGITAGHWGLTSNDLSVTPGFIPGVQQQPRPAVRFQFGPPTHTDRPAPPESAVIRLTLIAAMASVLLTHTAHAQPEVPADFYDRGVASRGNSVVFCIWPTSPLVALDRAVAQAIGDAQLFDVEFFEVPLTSAGAQETFEQELFIHLMDNCDAVMGGSLAWSPLPEWLTITRPYLEITQTIATSDRTIANLADLPPGTRVGSILMSPSDMVFATAIRAGLLPNITRIPYDTPARILAAIEAGRLEAGLVPDHAVEGYSGPTLASASTDPLRLAPEATGMLLLSSNTYLRALLDDAIASLEAQGTLDAVIGKAHRTID